MSVPLTPMRRAMHLTTVIRNPLEGSRWSDKERCTHAQRGWVGAVKKQKEAEARAAAAKAAEEHERTLRIKAEAKLAKMKEEMAQK